jgi:hypothetical protein
LVLPEFAFLGSRRRASAPHQGNGDDPTMTFDDARRQMMDSGVPSSGDDLLGMKVDFEEHLRRCAGVAAVSVAQTEDPDALITASCVALPVARPPDVAQRLVDTWRRHLRYDYSEAHQLTVTSTAVVLEVITQIDAGDFYVTGTITVRWQ